MEYAGSEKRRFVPFGTGAASYSARKIHYGLRDFVVGDQLSELRIIYRLPDALFLSRRGDAPAIMGKTNRSKTPRWRFSSLPARRF